MTSARLYCGKCSRPATPVLEHGRDKRGVLRVVAIRARCTCGAERRVRIEHGRRVNPPTGELRP